MALAQLKYHTSKGAAMLYKVLSSAVANAVENENRDPNSLVVARINVDEGTRMKRLRARAQGRGNRILKRTSHITIFLEDGEPFRTRKSNAKPKPRPKFDAPKSGKKNKQQGSETSEPVVAETAAEETAGEEAMPVAEPDTAPESEEPQTEATAEGEKEQE